MAGGNDAFWQQVRSILPHYLPRQQRPSAAGYRPAVKQYTPSPRYKAEFAASVVDVIRAAGRANKVLRITYNGQPRNVEPYSFRFRGGEMLLYAWCRLPGRKNRKFMTNLGADEDQHGWESFSARAIRDPIVTEEGFVPRTAVEL